MENCFAPPLPPRSWPDEGKDGISFDVPPSPWQAKPSSSSSEGRHSAALRIHSEAEKRRRARINARLSTLRRMIPNSNKMDKASLLGKVVDHLKELKRKALDIDQRIKIPAESNQVTVDLVDEEFGAAYDGNLYMRAVVCCDDRPDLLEDLMEAFDRLRLTTIRADMMSLGGRVQNVFLLCLNDSDGASRRSTGTSSSSSSGMCLSALKRSVRDKLDRVVSCSDAMASNVLSSKRRKVVMRSHLA